MCLYELCLLADVTDVCHELAFFLLKLAYALQAFGTILALSLIRFLLLNAAAAKYLDLFWFEGRNVARGFYELGVEHLFGLFCGLRFLGCWVK